MARGPWASHNLDLYTQLINQKGLNFLWSRAVLCACRLNTVTGQFDPTCGRCSHDGYRYVNPRAREERHLSRNYVHLHAVIGNVEVRRDDATVLSPWTTGEAVITVDGHNPVSYRDRFVGIDQRMSFTEVLTRGSVADVPVGLVGRTAATRVTAMRYEPLAINYVEHEDGTAYYEQEDFRWARARGG
jgi:hypothetical protein